MEWMPKEKAFRFHEQKLDWTTRYYTRKVIFVQRDFIEESYKSFADITPVRGGCLLRRESKPYDTTD